jgi:predicted metal-dependent phosphoesterase TrpH
MSDKTDLHLHTYYSDGTQSPEQVVRWAHLQGLHTIAITDHDGIDGIEEATVAAKEFGIKVIPGIEISAQTDEHIGLHILGYDIDTKNQLLRNACETMRKKRKIRNELLMKALNHLGYKLEWKDLDLRSGQDYLGKPQFAMAMVNKGYFKTPKDAFGLKGAFGSKEIRKIRKEKVSDAEAINIIQGAGGMAVLAHPAKISHIGEPGTPEFYSKLDNMLADLKLLGLGGLECVYPEHTDEQTIQFTIMAHRHGLKVTGGSDYHGPEFEPGYID